MKLTGFFLLSRNYICGGTSWIWKYTSLLGRCVLFEGFPRLGLSCIQVSVVFYHHLLFLSLNIRIIEHEDNRTTLVNFILMVDSMVSCLQGKP
jgi:hypothetical protein